MSQQDMAIIEECIHLKKTLSRDLDATATLELLEGLEKFNMTKEILRGSLIGKTVNEIFKKEGQDTSVKDKARSLVLKWKALAAQKDKLVTATEQTSTTRPPVNSQTSTAGLTSFRAGENPANRLDKSKHRRLDIRKKLLQYLKIEEVSDLQDDTQQQDLLDAEKVVVELEEEMWSQLVKRDDDKAYMTQIRSILFNLKDAKNPNFNYKILTGFFKPLDVPKMAAEEMASEHKQAERAKFRLDSMEEIQSDWAMRNGKIKICGMFTCGKCKGTETTYFQMQTRSSDEPMTTFVTCLACNNRWKFC